MALSCNMRQYKQINNYCHNQLVVQAQEQDMANCKEAALALSCLQISNSIKSPKVNAEKTIKFKKPSKQQAAFCQLKYTKKEFKKRLHCKKEAKHAHQRKQRKVYNKARRWNQIKNYHHAESVERAQAQDQADRKQPLFKLLVLKPRPPPPSPPPPPPMDKELQARKNFLEKTYKDLNEVNRIWQAGAPFRKLLWTTNEEVSSFKSKQMRAVKKVSFAKKLVADREKELLEKESAYAYTISL
ncbi:hypothetical protein IE81DRAFT_330799 [Ceraceosorus guamensis]|uniref:Uncharacterized protein n=1 Tax=Ceraceosorus guamensis TaxID=1522189 RepID=A0A316VVX7_9BASI|nr:hypothetical protein IE81DRAFT_330799 [Ceraceosorus guamensis]PWN41619.1 hypothetical protein IE81DRAFT_330799 [Ceraceosorus guamensis]